MHHLLERACNSGMCQIIKFYVDKKILTSILNSKISSFPFGSYAKPPVVKKQKIDREDICYSAFEMCSLVLCFSLLIGDNIPDDCPVREYYLTLQKILNLLLLKSLSFDDVDLINTRLL